MGNDINIPKNTMLRKKTAKELRLHLHNPAIERFDIEDEIKWKKRINQNIRKRIQSTLSFNTIKKDELADLISLLLYRARLENITEEDIKNEMNKLSELYGDYEDGWYATKEVDIIVEENMGFIPYLTGSNFTERLREKTGLNKK